MSSFLDSTGLGHLLTKIKTVLNSKANTSDLSAVATSGSYNDLNNKPTIPTTSTTITENDSNPVSSGAVYSKFADLIGSAPAALDTLQEIAAALNNDADLAGTLTTQISNKISKVSGATSGNFAALASDGTLIDSGHKHSDYVTSVNGTTGDITIDTGVLSFNGATGDITYNAPVTSVNGATGAVTVLTLPIVTATDNGKILMVVNGQWQLVSPSVLYSGNGIPNNNYGNNGDLFIQTD